MWELTQKPPKTNEKPLIYTLHENEVFDLTLITSNAVEKEPEPFDRMPESA
ncbi:MAG: hypothetical protein LH614_00770 [Pyrinomonadaceae bacterium]|nr:hypothetical protein [Pyrinomonadaceae bacterium]